MGLLDEFLVNQGERMNTIGQFFSRMNSDRRAGIRPAGQSVISPDLEPSDAKKTIAAAGQSFATTEVEEPKRVPNAA